jgi:hypothetical protein
LAAVEKNIWGLCSPSYLNKLSYFGGKEGRKEGRQERQERGKAGEDISVRSTLPMEKRDEEAGGQGPVRQAYY